MKKNRKVFSMVLVGVMTLTFFVSPLSIPRIPPVELRAAVEIDHTLV